MRTRNTKEKPSLFTSHEKKREAILFCSEMILRGESIKHICEELYLYCGLEVSKGIAFISETKDAIAESTAENNEKVVEIHMMIYEDIYRRFHTLENATGKMKVMQQKEKLLNLYQDESTEVVVNTQNNINIQSHYDVDKLNPHQQDRLQQLLLKAKQ